MEMLNNIKSLLNRTPDKNQDPIQNVNFQSGATILTHFQKQWEDLHQINEDNATSAAILAEIINELHAKIVNQNDCITKINQNLNANIQDNIQSCLKVITDLHKSFEDVEKALLVYEDVTEQYELEQMKGNHKFQLVMYEQKRLGGLDILRSELATKHAHAVIDFEKKQKKALEERQQVFQEAFKTDLETYKTLGTIPKIEVKTQPSALLEEIQLDVDDAELNQFLDEK